MKPSATETASAISLDPLLYLDDIWLVVLGDTVVNGGVGGTGLGVDGTVEFVLGCGVLTGGVDAGPVGRSPSGQFIQREFQSVADSRQKKSTSLQGERRLHDGMVTCAGRGGGRELEAAEERQLHDAGHVDVDGGPLGAGLVECLAEAERLVVHHAPQVGAAVSAGAAEAPSRKERQGRMRNSSVVQLDDDGPVVCGTGAGWTPGRETSRSATQKAVTKAAIVVILPLYTNLLVSC
jgi:hypothetical protein